MIIQKVSRQHFLPIQEGTGRSQMKKLDRDRDRYFFYKWTSKHARLDSDLTSSSSLKDKYAYGDPCFALSRLAIALIICGELENIY